MKKFLLILLLGIYSTAVTGISLKAFYCCGELKTVSVKLSAKGKNTKHTKNTDEGCCKTTYKYLQVNDNHVQANELAAPAKLFTFITPLYNFLNETVYPLQKNNTTYIAHAPPLYKNIPVYLAECVFRI